MVRWRELVGILLVEQLQRLLFWTIHGETRIPNPKSKTLNLSTLNSKR